MGTCLNSCFLAQADTEVQPSGAQLLMRVEPGSAACFALGEITF